MWEPCCEVYRSDDSDTRGRLQHLGPTNQQLYQTFYGFATVHGIFQVTAFTIGLLSEKIPTEFLR
jgi:hypothetical protein